MAGGPKASPSTSSRPARAGCRGSADGTFAVSKTMTIPGERLIALDAVVQLVVGGHGEPHGQNLAASQPVVRWRLPDGTRLQAAAQQPNKSGTPIGLT